MAASRNKLPLDLTQRVGNFLADHLADSQSLHVGLSGGLDSVVLLHVLAHIAPVPVRAIHVHHGLSPNADHWTAFCQDFCADLRVDLSICRVAVDASAGIGLEAAARNARYAAFASLPVECLFLAQHRGDQAETVLHNLLRGAGVLGLAGMPAARYRGPLKILRPLLSTGREEIAVYARQAGLRWIEDESNADCRLTRNFIRHEVLPPLYRRFPQGERALAAAASHLAEAAELLDALAQADWQALAVDGALPMRRLRTLDATRLKNLLRWRLRRLGWQAPVASRLDEFARQLLSAGADRHPALDLPQGRLFVAAGALHLAAGK